MFKTKWLVAALALCAVFPVQAKENKFHCFICNGKNICSDVIPPECASKERVVVEDGQRKKESQSQKPGQRMPLADPVAEKARVEAERRDTTLLSTYLNEDEIDLARKRNMFQIEARVNSNTTSLKLAQDSLAELVKERDGRLERKRPIPESLNADIKRTEELIIQRQQSLEISQKELDIVQQRYDNDKKRYRELKGLPPSGK